MGFRFTTIAVICLLAGNASAQPGAPSEQQPGDSPSPGPETVPEQAAASPEQVAPPAQAPAPEQLAPPSPQIEPHSEPSAAQSREAVQPQTAPSAVPSEQVVQEERAASAEQLALPSVDELELFAPDVVAVESPSFLSKIQIHGFVNAGGFISTANDYIGSSDRGSLKLFEAGINFSTELTDDLRVGLQLVSRSVGTLSEEVPRLDWAVIDYRRRPWLGLRAGVIKMPLGLYNEYIASDAARTPILLPQSVYPLRNRDALISHTGFAVYGTLSLGWAGTLDYQAWLGKLSVPRSALVLDGAALDSVDTRYVTGGQVFLHPRIDGLRIGATYLRAAIDFRLTLDRDVVPQVVEAGFAPADYDGRLAISQDPTSFWVVSAEYTRGDWLFAAEYSRWLTHQTSSLSALIPTLNMDGERFYAMATYRVSPYFEFGTYYSVTHAAADDRLGRGPEYSKSFLAFQRDLAGTLRFDVNDYWLWKLEGHFMDGAAELQSTRNPAPTRYWGLFLFRTTVTF